MKTKWQFIPATRTTHTPPKSPHPSLQMTICRKYISDDKEINANQYPDWMGWCRYDGAALILALNTTDNALSFALVTYGVHGACETLVLCVKVTMAAAIHCVLQLLGKGRWQSAER